jgi:serine/threonine protein kinase
MQRQIEGYPLTFSEFDHLLLELGYLVRDKSSCALPGQRLIVQDTRNNHEYLTVDVIDLVENPTLVPVCKNMEFADVLPTCSGLVRLKDSIFVKDEVFCSVLGMDEKVQRTAVQFPSAPEFWTYAADLARALRHMHRSEFVHGALSPQCIYDLEDGPAIGDFWWLHNADQLPLASHASDEITVSIPYATLPFLAPEQLEGEPPLRESDVFSLGAIFYYLLSGSVPRSQRSHHESHNIRRALLHTPVLPLLELVPDLDAGIAALIEQMMLHNPDDRPKMFDVDAIIMHRSGNAPDEEEEEPAEIGEEEDEEKNALV